MIETVTNLGDTALLLPGSFALLAYLVWRGQPQLALAWIGTLMLCLGLTAAAKLAFLACGEHVPAWRVESPSGHTSFSAAFYGACAVVIALQRPRWQGFLAGIGALSLILLIGLTRVLLRFHTLEEVLGGLVIGGLCVLAFGLLGARTGPPNAPLRPPALVVAVIFVILAAFAVGRHLSVEPWLERIADRLAPSLGCGTASVLSRGPRTASWSPSR